MECASILVSFFLRHLVKDKRRKMEKIGSTEDQKRHYLKEEK